MWFPGTSLTDISTAPRSLTARGFALMTRSAQRLQIRRVPEQRGIAVVFPNVIDFELQLDVLTRRARIRVVDEDLQTEAKPPGGAVPAAHVAIAAGVFAQHGMGTAATAGHEEPAARLRAVLHYGSPSRGEAGFCAL